MSINLGKFKTKSIDLESFYNLIIFFNFQTVFSLRTMLKLCSSTFFRGILCMINKKYKREWSVKSVKYKGDYKIKGVLNDCIGATFQQLIIKNKLMNINNKSFNLHVLIFIF